MTQDPFRELTKELADLLNRYRVDCNLHELLISRAITYGLLAGETNPDEAMYKINLLGAVVQEAARAYKMQVIEDLTEEYKPLFKSV